MIGRLKQLLKTNKFLSLISSGTAAVLGLLTFGLLARYFSPSELGYWSLFLSVYTLFDMLRAGLVSNAMIKKINEYDTEEEVKVVIGSGWKLSVLITLVGSIIISLVFLVIYFFNKDSFFLTFSIWFIPTSFLSLPHSMSTWILNAYVKFAKIVWVRFLLQMGFLIGIIIFSQVGGGVEFVIIAYLLSNFLPGLYASLKGWNKLKYWKEGTREMDRSLFNFGKYSMGSMIGSNLLRSSDSYLIFAFLGPAAQGIYAVAEKIVGLFDIPLRAFVGIAFPQLAKKYALGLHEEFQDEFERDAGFSTLLLLPISVLAFIFAEQLVFWLGGEDYMAAANVVRIFAVYTALTPLDRFSGIALDVVNRPDLNFWKVVIMLSANVVGDIAVLYFTQDIFWVAFVSIFTFATGIGIGFVFLKGKLPFRLPIILKKGFSEGKRLVKKYVGNS